MPPGEPVRSSVSDASNQRGIAEQTWIVAEVERRLSVVEELEWVVTANLQRATRLRQSILQKAFTGELASPK
jgi:type I restriction enzyme S subunit